MTAFRLFAAAIMVGLTLTAAAPRAQAPSAPAFGRVAIYLFLQPQHIVCAIRRAVGNIEVLNSQDSVQVAKSSALCT